MTDKRNKRSDHLEKSADMIAYAAYKLCQRSLKSKKEAAPDAKGLKDICAAVKEAIGICNGLEKNGEAPTESLKVIMENIPDEYAE